MSFHQDLNGDGTIGPPATVIEAYGSTRLTEMGNHFFLYDSSGSGPSLKFFGMDVAAGQFGDWTPIGAEIMPGAYEVAWKNGSADQYTVWNTDSSGNYISNATAIISGADYSLTSLEPSFHQDLNGDGQVGPPATVIEASGSTHLTEMGNHFFLYDSNGSGPSLKMAGGDVVAGQFGAWTPIGAEVTASGYEIAWKNGSADQYTVWNTDSSGNYTSNAASIVSGSDHALTSLEPSFHQDLNGDGVIGVAQLAQGQLVSTIDAGATLEILSSYSGSVVFAGTSGTLKLDNSSSFSGTVAGISGQDTIDFAEINFATVNAPTYAGDSSHGTLTVTDGSHTANIALLGNYLASSFAASSDGHGGTLITDPPGGPTVLDGHLAVHA